MKRLLTTSTIVAGALFFGVSAHATIVFDPTPGPAIPGGEENVIFEQPDLTPGLVQIGDTNKTGTNVTFDTNFSKGTGSLGGAGTGQFIVADGIGHANLICTTGGTACGTFSTGGANGAQLTSLEMKPTDPTTGWGDALLNLDFGEGTANIFVTDNVGNNFSFILGNGENKFSLTGTNGEVITDIQITQRTATTGPFGFNMLKQPDISGVCTITGPGTCVPIPTPEPGTLALLGLGLLGTLVSARRKRR